MSTEVTTYEEDKGFGWLFFAGTVLGLAGLMRIVDSIWAFRYKGRCPTISGRRPRGQPHDLRLGVAHRRHPPSRLQLLVLAVAVRTVDRVDRFRHRGASAP